jgi:hypothetical protein
MLNDKEFAETTFRTTIDSCWAEHSQIEQHSTIFSSPPRDPPYRALGAFEFYRQKAGRWMVLIAQDIAKYAGAKKLEWIMMGMTLHLAYKLSLPYETFAQSNSFSVLQLYLSENGWALVFSLLGIGRLVVLTFNGLHFKHAPEMRMAMAAISFAIFSMWVWGIDAGNSASLNGVICKWLALGELMNIWQASADRLTNKAAKDAGNR